MDIPPVRTAATLSIDLVNKWAYLKRHTQPDWKWLPTYLPTLVPRLLALLEKQQIKATIFVSGQDALMPEHHDCLRAITTAGHEIGSLAYPFDDPHIGPAEEQIEETTGQKPAGFRSTGNGISQTILEVLIDRGYLYDTSARKAVKPFQWHLNNGRLLEIPISSVPVIRCGLQMGYAMCLGRISERLAATCFRAALACCREPSVLISSADLLSGEETSGLDFLRSTATPVQIRSRVVGRCLELLTARYDVQRMDRYAQLLLQRGDLAQRLPDS